MELSDTSYVQKIVESNYLDDVEDEEMPALVEYYALPEAKMFVPVELTGSDSLLVAEKVDPNLAQSERVLKAAPKEAVRHPPMRMSDRVRVYPWEPSWINVNALKSTTGDVSYKR